MHDEICGSGVADFERFHTDVLTRLPGVERSNTMQVLRTVKQTTALLLDGWR